MRSLYYSPIFLVIILLTGAGIFMYLSEAQAPQQKRSFGGATRVSTFDVKMKNTDRSIEALGTTRASESVNLTVQQSGVIDQLFFDDGAAVTANQPLLELVSLEEQARLKELNINLAEAKRQLNRIENLAKDNVASQQLLDEQKGQVNVLMAQIDVVKSQLQELKVNAPFTGILGYRQVSKGALLRPGDIITSLDAIDVLNVDFSVSERFFSAVSRGMRVTATTSAADGMFEGTISSIDSRIDPVTRSVVVRAKIDNRERQLRPGMLLDITITQNSVQQIIIPESALVPSENMHFVFVVNDENVVSKAQITIGQRTPGWVEVVAGLEPDQVIVVEGAMKIRSGSKVATK